MSTQPREWLAALTSPSRGIMDMSPGAWNHSPPSVERVRVREVMPDEPSTVVAAAAAGSTDTAAAINAAMTDLARELGCFWRDLIPHNAGLFIPGQAQACADPVDAIRRLFAHVHAGGHVLRSPAISPNTPAARAGKADPSPIEVDPRQVALFEV